MTATTETRPEEQAGVPVPASLDLRKQCIEVHQLPPDASPVVARAIGALKFLDEQTGLMDTFQTQATERIAGDIEVLQDRTTQNIERIEARYKLLERVDATLGTLIAEQDTDDIFLSELALKKEKAIGVLQATEGAIEQTKEAAEQAKGGLYEASAASSVCDADLYRFEATARGALKEGRSAQIAGLQKYLDTMLCEKLDVGRISDLLDPDDRQKLRDALRNLNTLRDGQGGYGDNKEFAAMLQTEVDGCVARAYAAYQAHVRGETEPQIERLKAEPTPEELRAWMTDEDQVEHARLLAVRRETRVILGTYDERCIALTQRLGELESQKRDVENALKHIDVLVESTNTMVDGRMDRLERLIVTIQTMLQDLRDIEGIDAQVAEIPESPQDATPEAVIMEEQEQGRNAGAPERDELARQHHERRAAIRMNAMAYRDVVTLPDGSQSSIELPLRLSETAAGVQSIRDASVRAPLQRLLGRRTEIFDTSRRKYEDLCVEKDQILGVLDIERQELCEAGSALRRIAGEADDAAGAHQLTAAKHRKLESGLESHRAIMSLLENERAVIVDRGRRASQALAEKEFQEATELARCKQWHDDTEKDLYKDPHSDERKLTLVQARQERGIWGPEEFNGIGWGEDYERAQQALEAAQRESQEAERQFSDNSEMLAMYRKAETEESERLRLLAEELASYETGYVPYAMQSIAGHEASLTAARIGLIHKQHAFAERAVMPPLNVEGPTQPARDDVTGNDEDASSGMQDPPDGFRPVEIDLEGVLDVPDPRSRHERRKNTLWNRVKEDILFGALGAAAVVMPTPQSNEQTLKHNGLKRG